MIKGVCHRISLFFISFLLAWFLRMWFATCRVHVHEEKHRREAEKDGKPTIGSCYHCCVVGSLVFFCKNPYVMMVSASKDGDYVTRIAENMGYEVVRGSRNRKGVTAAKKMIGHLRKGKTIGLIADGSQGPPKIVQAGSILFAAKTGASILPTTWSASRYFTFNSWDRLILPRPFCRIDLLFGEPLIIPTGNKTVEKEKYRVILEKKMNELYDLSWQMQGRKEH